MQHLIEFEIVCLFSQNKHWYVLSIRNTRILVTLQPKFISSMWYAMSYVSGSPGHLTFILWLRILDCFNDLYQDVLPWLLQSGRGKVVTCRQPSPAIEKYVAILCSRNREHIISPGAQEEEEM